MQTLIKLEMTLARACDVVSAKISVGTSIARLLKCLTIDVIFGDSSSWCKICAGDFISNHYISDTIWHAHVCTCICALHILQKDTVNEMDRWML